MDIFYGWVRVGGGIFWVGGIGGHFLWVSRGGGGIFWVGRGGYLF